MILTVCLIGSTSLFAQQADTLKSKQKDDGTVNITSSGNKGNHIIIADDGTVVGKKMEVHDASVTVQDTITMNGKRAVEFEDGTWKYLGEGNNPSNK